jgi:hypothetical protein
MYAMARAKAILVAAVIVASTIGMARLVAVPASADRSDDKFLRSVRGMNLVGLNRLVGATPDLVIKAGRSVCTMLDAGYGTRPVQGMLKGRLAINSDYDAMTVGINAASAYCPRHQADSGFNDNF